jgi:carbon starvation protein
MVKKWFTIISWIFVALVGAFSLGLIALYRGEPINALWLLAASLSVYLIAYRYYARFIADKVLKINPNRRTPAYCHNDGLDYVPTNKYVLFGHHFAAIAGAGPLVGPILAAQMGYLPGVLWILFGVVFAGAVQDCMILFISTRRDAGSLGELIKIELGIIPGILTLFGTFMILIILLAVLALIVVKALIHSPWGTFTILTTIPIALFMGIAMRYFRVGNIAEISFIGFILLILAIIIGGFIAKSAYAFLFDWDGQKLCWALIIYGFFAALLPVWLLLAPRDYLSTFLKIGTIIGLSLGLLWVAPQLKMPALTPFIDGTGPVWSGSLFPFLFITIACGAVSGFHALIASGTTPKMIENEAHIPFIGYGAMLMESFVAVMALIAASIIEPGIYFAMNSPTAILGPNIASTVSSISHWGFYITPEMLTDMARSVGEQSIISRAGGAPTLAVGMAHILSTAIGGKGMTAFWYHFAIVFEALFILTAVDAGTRVGRFMLHDLLGTFIPPLKNTQSLWGAFLATGICVGLWGYFLYQGVIDPLGGINTLWPLFGIANQMLAGIALLLCTTVLFKMKQQKMAWVVIIPAIFILITTLTAGFLKIWDPNPKIGFLSLAQVFSNGILKQQIIAPAKTMADMHLLVFNSYVDATLAGFFLLIECGMIFFVIKACLNAQKSAHPTVKEATYHAHESSS